MIPVKEKLRRRMAKQRSLEREKEELKLSHQMEVREQKIDLI